MSVPAAMATPPSPVQTSTPAPPTPTPVTVTLTSWWNKLRVPSTGPPLASVKLPEPPAATNAASELKLGPTLPPLPVSPPVYSTTHTANDTVTTTLHPLVRWNGVVPASQRYQLTFRDFVPATYDEDASWYGLGGAISTVGALTRRPRVFFAGYIPFVAAYAMSIAAIFNNSDPTTAAAVEQRRARFAQLAKDVNQSQPRPRTRLEQSMALAQRMEDDAAISRASNIARGVRPPLPNDRFHIAARDSDVWRHAFFIGAPLIPCGLFLGGIARTHSNPSPYYRMLQRSHALIIGAGVALCTYSVLQHREAVHAWMARAYDRPPAPTTTVTVRACPPDNPKPDVTISSNDGVSAISYGFTGK